MSAAAEIDHRYKSFAVSTISQEVRLTMLDDSTREALAYATGKRVVDDEHPDSDYCGRQRGYRYDGLGHYEPEHGMGSGFYVDENGDRHYDM